MEGIPGLGLDQKKEELYGLQVFPQRLRTNVFLAGMKTGLLMTWVIQTCLIRFSATRISDYKHFVKSIDS